MSIGERLARDFEAANETLIRAVERASDEEWRKPSPEGWTAGVTLHHVAESYEGLTAMVRGIAEGAQPPNFTVEMLDQGNAEHARRAANVTQAETAEMLRNSGKKAAEMLRSLTDEQFARTAPMPLMNGAPLSAQQVAENVLVGHGLGHFKGVEQAFEARS